MKKSAVVVSTMLAVMFLNIGYQNEGGESQRHVTVSVGETAHAAGLVQNFQACYGAQYAFYRSLGFGVMYSATFATIDSESGSCGG